MPDERLLNAPVDTFRGGRRTRYCDVASAFFDLGIDGVFSDYTDTAIAARDWYYDESTAKQAG